MRTPGLILAVLLAGCGSGTFTPEPEPPAPPAPPLDAFYARVSAVVAAASEDAEPASVDAIVATTPEDSEPVAF